MYRFRNREYCFKCFSFFEIGLSDHRHLIYSILKTTFKKEKPKLYKHCDYKKVNSTTFHTNLQSKLEEGRKVYHNFEETFVGVLDAHAPRKTKVFRGNHIPDVDNDLKNTILKLSAIKYDVIRTKQQEDITKH